MKLIPYLALAILLVNCQTDTNKKTKTFIFGDDGKRLDSLLTPYVQNLRTLTDNTAGLAIGVTKGDQIIYARTFGYSNLEKGIETDFNTLFHIASVSKPFTAAMVIKLIELHQLQLDDLLIDYIPEFQMQGEAYKRITIRHILTHTSGIPRHVSENDWLNPKSLEANLDFVKDFELDFEPGSQFSYSNSAFDILGIVISRVSGMSFTDCVTSKILKPSGMTNSTYNKSIDSLPNSWASPYSYGLQTQKWSPYPHADNYAPSSGLQSTLIDMCHWGIMHINQGAFEGQQVLNSDSFKLMITPQYETPWNDHIGLSWFLQSYLELPIIMHSGTDTGFESIMYIYPENNISIVVMANRDFSRTGRIINAASEILFNQLPKDYTVSAKYKFAEAYKKQGIDYAKALWERMREDSTDIYVVDNDDILTTGAVLENGKQWKDAKTVLHYYTSLNEQSTYAWRLLGNANLNLGDTASAITCYKKTLAINPNYEKGRIALDALTEKKSATH